MIREFYDWHVVKDTLHTKINTPAFFNERDVWWCSLGANVGYEINGKDSDFSRPVLIIKKFSSNTMLVLPITSKQKDTPFHYHFQAFSRVKDGAVVLDQVRLLDSKRLARRLGTFPRDDFIEVKAKFKAFL